MGDRAATRPAGPRAAGGARAASGIATRLQLRSPSRRAAAALLALAAAACAEPRKIEPADPRVLCGAWTSGGSGVRAGDAPAVVGRGARWAVVDRAGELLVYRSATRGVVVRNVATGDEREVTLGEDMYLFPSAVDAGRVVAFEWRRSDGLQQYSLLDLFACRLSEVPIRVSTTDPVIGYSKVSAVALRGDALFSAISRGSLRPSRELLVDVPSARVREAAASPQRVFEARVEPGRVAWLEQTVLNGPPAIGGWDLDADFVRTIALPSNAAPQGLSFSGTRAVWADLRNAQWTRNEDIYLADLATGWVEQLTTDAASQNQPSILGHLVAWSDARAGTFDIRVRDLDTGEERVVAQTSADERSPMLTEGGLFWLVPAADGAAVWFDPAVRP